MSDAAPRLPEWAGQRLPERAVHHERKGDDRPPGGGPVSVLQEAVGPVRPGTGGAP
jgi:hypothetical protein